MLTTNSGCRLAVPKAWPRKTSTSLGTGAMWLNSYFYLLQVFFRGRNIKTLNSPSRCKKMWKQVWGNFTFPRWLEVLLGLSRWTKSRERRWPRIRWPWSWLWNYNHWLSNIYDSNQDHCTGCQSPRRTWGRGRSKQCEPDGKVLQPGVTNILSTFPVYFLAFILKTLPSLMQLIMIYSKLMRVNCNL